MKLKKYLNKHSYSIEGKYIKFPAGEEYILTREEEPERLIIEDKDGNTMSVCKIKGGKVYGKTNKYDKTWKNMKDFVEWLSVDNNGWRPLGYEHN